MDLEHRLWWVIGNILQHPKEIKDSAKVNPPKYCCHGIHELATENVESNDSG
jgi:hypothetical protein